MIEDLEGGNNEFRPTNLISGAVTDHGEHAQQE
jgi:hypothetical protein